MVSKAETKVQISKEVQERTAWLSQQTPAYRKQLVEELIKRYGGFTRELFHEIGFTTQPTRGWRKRFIDGSSEQKDLAISKRQRRRAKRELRKERKIQRVAAKSQDDFLQSYEWRCLRYRVIVKHGSRCMACGRTPRDGIVIHVDHIKPRREHPELALVFENLQILCNECNHGKGNWDETDWREPRIATLMGESV